MKYIKDFAGLVTMTDLSNDYTESPYANIICN